MASDNVSGQVAATFTTTREDVQRADLSTKLILGAAGIFTLAGAILLIDAAVSINSAGFVAKNEAASFTFEVADNAKFHRGICIYDKALNNVGSCSSVAEYLRVEPPNGYGITPTPDCTGPTAWSMAQDPPLRRLAHYEILTSGYGEQVRQVAGTYKVKKAAQYWVPTSVEENPLFATDCMENGDTGSSALSTTSVVLFHISSIMWAFGFYRLSARKLPQASPARTEVAEQSHAKEAAQPEAAQPEAAQPEAAEPTAQV